MVRQETICGYWIKREKQGLLFEDEWLEQLNETYILAHDKANDLYNEYQQGNIDAARDGLKDTQASFHKLKNFINDKTE